MKKLLFAFLAMLTLVTLSSCTKDEPGNDKPDPEVPEVIEPNYVDATSQTAWHYLVVEDGEQTATLVGTAEDTDDAEWAKRTDWDFAIQRYVIRTNGGNSSSKDAKGGLYTFAKDAVYADITTTPAGAMYVLDEVKSVGMKSKITTAQPKAATIIMIGMPPVYEKSPIYAIKSADGERVYMIEFLGYHSDDNVSGHITFNVKEIADGGTSTTDTNFIDATSGTTWNYFAGGSITAKLVGAGVDADDAKWAARTDWDFAIQGNYIRTNGGTSSSTGAMGAIHVSETPYSSIKYIPAKPEYTVDAMGKIGMTQKESSLHPIARAAIMDMSNMPPVYTKAPIYVLKSANGEKVYKIDFTKYVNHGEATFKIMELEAEPAE